MKLAIGLLVCAISRAGAASAEAPKPVTESQTTTVKATVIAVDQANRTLTLKGEAGRVVTMKVPPEVKRFAAIKVGDVLTAHYVQSMVVRLVGPGETLPHASVDAAVTPRAGDKPGATIAQQSDMKVKVTAIDLKTPALTVQTPDGNNVSLMVKDKSRLEKLKVGDEINITYTEALLLSVD